MSTQNLLDMDAVRQRFSDRNLEYASTVRWTLRAASSDGTYVWMANSHGVIHKAYSELIVVLLPQSPSRTQALQERMMRMKYRDKILLTC